MSTATLSKNTAFTPMLPIFVEDHAQAIAENTQLDDDRAYLKLYLSNWGKGFGSSENKAGDFKTFMETAARVSATA